MFYRLDELAPGDRVEVARSDGKAFDYRVVTVESHAKDAFPTARVYGPAPGPVLRLVTCGGEFDPRSRHYRDNVVVTAVPALSPDGHRHPRARGERRLPWNPGTPTGRRGHP